MADVGELRGKKDTHPAPTDHLHIALGMYSPKAQGDCTAP